MGADWHRGDWMQTFTGRQFYPMDPKADDIDPRDIAHALSMLCRYNGHVDRFYSVAEHCVLMSSAMPTPDLALWALLHDATEAYVGDMIRPLKVSMPAYREAEDRVMAAIVERFDLPSVTMPPAVKDADSRILLSERDALMGSKAPARWGQDGMEPLPVKVEGWSPLVAESRYLKRLEELTEPEPDLGMVEPEWDDFDDRAEQDADAARYARRYE